MTRFRRAVRLAPIVLSVVLYGQENTASVVSRIEWADLPPTIVEQGPDLKTGYLIVPERRNPVPSGREIRLPFLILKSRSSSPRPDPIFYTAGGPGGSTIYARRRFAQSPLLEERDLILLEQRGNRFAEPALLCPEIDVALRSGWGTRLNGDPDPRAMRDALSAARRSVEEKGIDLAGYTTAESAADIAELRRLLGIPSWNLYGVSYSTKLMLTVLRNHPQGVRSVILDSVMPLEANYDEEVPANVLGVLERIFALCREDESLRSRFPDLRSRFFRALAEANRRPFEIVVNNSIDGGSFPLKLDGAGVMNALYAGLEDTSTVPRIPLIIEALCRKEHGALAPLARTYLASSQGTAWGMRIAVWCNEEFPFERLEKILKPAGLPAELSRFIQPQVPLDALRLWPQGRPAAKENEPVRSRVPILIAAGEFDPDTPAEAARRTARFLPNAHFVEFAGYSHVPLYRHPEAARIMREFLADPARRPDPGKAAERPPFALTWDGRTP